MEGRVGRWKPAGSGVERPSPTGKLEREKPQSLQGFEYLVSLQHLDASILWSIES